MTGMGAALRALEAAAMKSETHPAYHPVVFVDGEHEIITRSTLTSGETRNIDGVDHYVIGIDVSSYSHPFYTGMQRTEHRAGRVERFRQKYGLQG